MINTTRGRNFKGFSVSEVDLGQTLDAKIANQDDHLTTLLWLGEDALNIKVRCDARTQTDSFVSLPQDIGRLRRKVNDDVRLVLTEIIRVQKALQVGASAAGALLSPGGLSAPVEAAFR